MRCLPILARLQPLSEDGARALRAVMEGRLMDVMHEAAGREDVEDVWPTEDVVMARAAPLLGRRSETD